MLFMLYIEPVVKVLGALRFGYADDILNLYIGDTLTDLIPTMEADYQQLSDLGIRMGSPFNPDKTEV